ncbi:ATP-binding protein [Candidatus Woesearchaeota archaeon]|nr:ATP-binding protein [Candidatus Woesearchaeota archaeon]
MILGRVSGKVSTTDFQFIVTSAKTKKFQFIQVNHPEYGFVLGQIMELIRTAEEMVARCVVIGYKEVDGRIKSIRTPFNLGIEVLEAEDSFIKHVIELNSEGGYVGHLEGKTIPVKVDLQKILTKHLCVLAKSGAGKSYAVGVLVEEIMDKNVPLVIIDPHGEYSSMKFPAEESGDTLEKWNIKAQGYGKQIQEYGDITIKKDVRPLKLDEKMGSYELMRMLPLQLSNTQEAMLFSVVKDLQEINFENILLGLRGLNSGGKWSIIDTIIYLRDLKIFSASPTPLMELVRAGKISVINLKGIAPEIQDVIVYKLLKDLFNARKQEKIPPFFCVIEEAHNFCPEKGFGKAKSTEVIRLISSEGRKFGLGLCVVSQRPALVQKTVLAQCSTQLIMKVTNPNDLRAITGSIEGITAETEQEIQNLSVGSALLCGFVDRPLVVTVRPRKSKHGGQAVDILKGASEDEYDKNIFEETKKFEESGLMMVVKPQVSVKEIKLMAEKPITKITTYLIPAVFLECELRGVTFSVLLDRVKGKIIIDPDKDIKQDISTIGYRCNFLRKPVYESVEFDVKIDEQITAEKLKVVVEKYCSVLEIKECFIVYNQIIY